MARKIRWNSQVKLILSDVDETVADLYLPATSEMIAELSRILAEGAALFLITGQGLESVRSRILNFIQPALRKNILVGPCSGVEVWGHDESGQLLPQPYYSLYNDKLTIDQQKIFRQITAQLTKEFHLKTVPTMPVREFAKLYPEDPQVVMYEDRTSQITFEFVNGHNYKGEDLRVPFFERAEELLQEALLPISPRIAGMFAVDFVVEGVSKTTAVQYVLNDPDILRAIGLSYSNILDPDSFEIWGDKFSTIHGGSDRFMSEAVDPQVRSIDFRDEDPTEFLTGYNIVLWTGKKRLHEGLLEYLQSR